MSSRRIARELAVILMPQLPKEGTSLERAELEKLSKKAVQMLVDYAKQCLADANGFMLKAQQRLNEQEIEHPDNKYFDELKPVALTSDDLRFHLDLMDRALHLTSEALDVPQMRLNPADTAFLFNIITTYLEHREQVDQIISAHKEKWRLERMVSIDRDILRLACSEAFFSKDVPINVSISEAVELSHRFADERAAKFINGVLADVATEAQEYRASGRSVVQGA